MAASSREVKMGAIMTDHMVYFEADPHLMLVENPETVSAALQAISYARRIIPRTSNSMELSALTTAEREELLEEHQSMLRDAFLKDRFSLEENEAMEEFHNRLEAGQVHEIGNCGELTYAGLDFMANAFPGINAEQYEIPGLDHTFLVLGRKKGSKLSDPSTWGDDAVVCDPWAGKVFKANPYPAQFKEHMKGFRGARSQKDGSFHDRLLDFNPEHPSFHKVKRRSKEYTSSFIQKHRKRHRKKLLKVFKKRVGALHASTEKYIKSLESIHKRLVREHGADNDKARIIQAKIDQIQPILTRMEKALETRHVNKNYMIAREELETELKEEFEAISEVIHFTGAEERDLSRHQATDRFQQKMNEVLGRVPRSSRDVDDAKNEMEKGLEHFDDSPKPKM